MCIKEAHTCTVSQVCSHHYKGKVFIQLSTGRHRVHPFPFSYITLHRISGIGSGYQILAQDIRYWLRISGTGSGYQQDIRYIHQIYQVQLYNAILDKRSHDLLISVGTHDTCTHACMHIVQVQRWCHDVCTHGVGESHPFSLVVDVPHYCQRS